MVVQNPARLLGTMLAVLLAVSFQRAHANALSDLQVVDGTACGLKGSTQKVVVNNNKNQRIVANIKVDSNVMTYKYVDKNGVEQDFNYPYQREVRLLPGATAIVGCTLVPVSYQSATQSFTVAGAFYPDPGVVFPAPPENPDDFVGWIYKNLPPGFSCEDGTNGSPLMLLHNRHPYRALLVDVSDSLLGHSFNAPIRAQYASSAFGCSKYNGQWRNWKISNIRFSTPMLGMPLDP